MTSLHQKLIKRPALKRGSHYSPSSSFPANIAAPVEALKHELERRIKP
ncbi:hypothetical protein HanXRQr2_Chr16g0753931 [Helianthus annuus]|uniref:Uncharacterized protein n=1 Tax=Helianthus annuus TaxID=4232 RepID=A0A9K3DT36_HELAN|nr:hypothetical protein HanXRQr2_Chr16g0753931 [Helianthus annuus]KAJ0821640.1 hypothetical protein HanPSC8_Chr16g0722621 [Helianthus annuus]